MKISILAPDLSHNCLGRAYLLAKVLSWHYEVETIGPILGNDIWKPLAYQNGLTYESVKVRASLYFLLYIRGMLKGIACDVHYFGYNFKRLKDMLEEMEFTDIENRRTRFTYSRSSVLSS